MLVRKKWWVGLKADYPVWSTSLSVPSRKLLATRHFICTSTPTSLQVWQSGISQSAWPDILIWQITQLIFEPGPMWFFQPKKQHFLKSFKLKQSCFLTLSPDVNLKAEIKIKIPITFQPGLFDNKDTLLIRRVLLKLLAGI